MAERGPVNIDDLAPKPRNDAYTVLLVISLVAMILACVLLWYNLKEFGGTLDPKQAGVDTWKPQPAATTPLTPPEAKPAP